VALETREVAPGLWVWRTAHPDWAPGLHWEETVTSTVVETGGEVAVLDPLVPRHAAPGGVLKVWGTPWHEERALPALRALLRLPFEHVIVSHGEPVHDRAAYERALETDPFTGEEGLVERASSQARRWSSRGKDAESPNTRRIGATEDAASRRPALRRRRRACFAEPS
jgi:hypothetical protein